MIERIGVLTRDCSGINAAIRAIVRSSYYRGVEVIGVFRGYDGLIDGIFKKLTPRDVSGIINQGGTILKTARAHRFFEEKFQKIAVENLKKNKIEGLIVVGGNGSLTAAHILASKYGIKVIGVPATIDNDINGIEYSIGTDTALNVALDALDKIRDTATSLERIFVVEVMGRDCGYIALNIALAGGCEEVIIPEREYNCDDLCKDIQEGHRKGKMSWIIIVAEGKAHAQDIGKVIRERTGLEVREVVLGHVQRGGRPTFYDRILGAKLGNYAVELLLEGFSDRCVGISRDNEYFSIPLEEAIRPKVIEVEKTYSLIKILT